MAQVAEKTHTVLICDDEPTTRTAIARGLARAGLSIAGVAASGAQAVVMARKTKPDVVLMDLRMPGMDGVEATQRIRELDPEIRIIVLTAHASLESATAAVRMGVSDYLIKPCAIRDIEASIRKVVSRPAITSSTPLPSTTPEVLEVLAEDDTSLFLGALLHQLSNTIVPVREIVRLAKQSENPQKHLEMIESYVSRTIETLQRLRTPLISRQLQATDLLEVISSAKEQIPIPDDIRTEVDVPEQARMVIGNPEALLDVFVNLMLNAVQAMESGGVLVVKSKVVENEWIEVRVMDTGCGIPVKQQARLFEPFFTTKEGGQGLGLWLSRELIKRLGGELVLEKSKPGEGTTFVIRLPLIAESSRDSEVIGGSDES